MSIHDNIPPESAPGGGIDGRMIVLGIIAFPFVMAFAIIFLSAGG